VKYLSNKPFSSAPTSDAYRSGWDATFGDDLDKHIATRTEKNPDFPELKKLYMEFQNLWPKVLKSNLPIGINTEKRQGAFVTNRCWMRMKLTPL
jgi:hypothetical protein